MLRGGNPQGFTLPAILVGLALISIMMTSFLSFLRYSFTGSRKIADLGEMEDIQQLILMRRDCAQIRANFLSNTGGLPIDLLGRDGLNIFLQTNLGPWLVASKTAADWTTSGTIEVTAQKTAAGNPRVLFPDPLVCRN